MASARKLASTTNGKSEPTNSLVRDSTPKGEYSHGDSEHLELLAATVAAGYVAQHLPVDRIAVNAVAVAQDISRLVRGINREEVPAMAMAATAEPHEREDESGDIAL